ncbi:dormancy-associated protein homolog 3-like isoform X1 [Syzygium oleosum]|uniref:dormancy-associated protein homolog 3-like isoform X1 n=1 Tax=Syzygium oleosum TaxID=219896 RepID=UPI0011D2C609|nr:dormancy-associated protein homolog 3-like isoform X1 [Syzygium oleosum]
MGLLDQLWDDTVAGPRPESGLGRLRKFSTFSSRSSSGKESEGGGSVKTYGDQEAAPSEEAIKVTRSITIVKPPGYQSGSPPVSPAGSTPPVSPFSGKNDGGGRGQFLFRRRSMSDAYEKPSEARPRSTPDPYDV